MSKLALKISNILNTSKGKAVAFDYETTGFDPYTKEIFGFVLTDEDGVSEVYDLDAPGKQGRIARAVLRAFFKDTSIEKIAHNLKFELHFTLRSYGITIPDGTIFHDTMIMSQIADNLEKSHRLEDLTALYHPDKKLKRHWAETDRKVRFQAAARGKRYDRVDRELMHEYQINDGFRTMLLFQLFKPIIEPYWENYRYEVETVIATQIMEDFGLYPHKENIKEMKHWLTTEIDETFDKLFPLMNGFENFNSDKVLRKYLYEIKGYQITFWTDTGEPGTDKEVFFKLLDEHPEDKNDLNNILKYRSYIKGLSMVEGYHESIHPTTGLIHHNINTNSARTGRQSASNPNMQNVAKSNAMKIVFPVPARKCFSPRPDSVLLFVDYSGIEMRLIIEAVKEPTMIEVLKSGGDIHALASEYWFGEMFTDPEICIKEYVPLNETLFEQHKELINQIGSEKANEKIYTKARKVLRGAGKNSQFGLAYGGKFEVLRKAANIPEGIFRPGFEAYCERFPLIANFTPSSMTMARKNGFVTTSFGRRLFIEKSRIHTAANYRIQGTAAEMLKRSTVHLHKFLDQNHPDVRLIVPIHDELMIHCPNDYLPQIDQFTKRMGQEMTNFPMLDVPIEVEWEITEQTWNDKMDLPEWLLEKEKMK